MKLEIKPYEIQKINYKTNKTLMKDKAVYNENQRKTLWTWRPNLMNIKEQTYEEQSLGTFGTCWGTFWVRLGSACDHG